MAKLTKKNRLNEVAIRKMQRLAGLMVDNSDLEDSSDLLYESSEIPGRVPSPPTGPVSARPGPEAPVLYEEEEVLEDEVLEDEVLEDEALEDEDELGNLPDMGGMGESDLDGMGSVKPGQREIVDAIKVLCGALGIEMEEVSGEGLSEKDLGEEQKELPSEEEFGGMSGGMDDNLNINQQKMLAEIFAKTSKQIFDTIKKAKKTSPKKTSPKKAK